MYVPPVPVCNCSKNMELLLADPLAGSVLATNGEAITAQSPARNDDSELAEIDLDDLATLGI